MRLRKNLKETSVTKELVKLKGNNNKNLTKSPRKSKSGGIHEFEEREEAVKIEKASPSVSLESADVESKARKSVETLEEEFLCENELESTESKIFENHSNKSCGAKLRKNLKKSIDFNENSQSSIKISHIPALKTVVGRSAEYNFIQNQILSFLNSSVGAVLYITGVPGSGKTYTTIGLLKYLNLDFVYLNCSILKNKTEIFKKIGTSTNCIRLSTDKISNLRNHYMKCNQRHILIIDEIDFLFTKNEKILYNLFELPFLENSNLIIIVISNTLGSLSSKTESRIGKNRIEFKPYSADQLKNVILSENKNDQIDMQSLDLITKRIASSTGDIRKVKDLVETSGNAHISKMCSILKDSFCPLLTKFVHSFNLYQKVILHLNREPKLPVQQWFENFKTFCVIKNIKSLEYYDFLYVANDLVSFGIYKIQNDGQNAVSCYLNEEIEQATKNDEDFKNFKANKTLG